MDLARVAKLVRSSACLAKLVAPPALLAQEIVSIYLCATVLQAPLTPHKKLVKPALYNA